MYEMAKKAREAMRGKAKRLAGEKDQKVDSSDFTPAPMLNADVKTGMRPISKQGFKDGGKIAATHAGRKPRKSGGRAITADSLINRDQKEANEDREGKKHIGGMKKGGRTGKAMGGGPTDSLRNSMNPQAYIRNVLGPTMGMKKGGKAKKAGGGMMDRVKNPNPSPDYSPKTDPSYKPPANEGPSKEEKDKLTEMTRKAGGRSARKAGGNVNYGPMEMPAGKKGMSTSEQVALEKKQDAASKPTRGKAKNYADGGMAPYGSTAPVAAMGPDPKSIVQKNAMNFGAGAPGSPYKKGGAAKHEDVAEDKALIKKMVKPSARTGKKEGGSSIDPIRGLLTANAMDDSNPFSTQGLAKMLSSKKSGGRTGKKEGGFLRTLGDRVAGDLASDEAMKIKDKIMGSLSGDNYKKGGRTKREDGGLAMQKLRNIARDTDPRDTVKPQRRVDLSDFTDSMAHNPDMGEMPGKWVPAKPKNIMGNKKGGRVKRATGGGTFSGSGYPGKVPGVVGGRIAKALGGETEPKKATKGNTAITINIAAGPKPGDMPPGLPPRPAGGIPVPMGMPPAGAAAPMPMPMPAPAPMGGGMPPMGRKAGGKVYRTYKDMDAGAGSGLGRLEKTEIQKRKA